MYKNITNIEIPKQFFECGYIYMKVVDLVTIMHFKFKNQV